MNYQRVPLGPLWTNSYTFWDEQGAAFTVDPGGSPEDVLDLLKKKGLNLKAIVLTHGHADHLIGVVALKKATGATVIMPRLDEYMASDANASMAWNIGAEQEYFEPDSLVDDGDEFSIGRFNLTCIHTPGHTPGSSCFLVEHNGEKVLVSGDTLFARSIGRTDFPGGDDEKMWQSLHKLYDLSGDLPVLPGHGPETSLQREREENQFLRTFQK